VPICSYIVALIPHTDMMTRVLVFFRFFFSFPGPVVPLNIGYPTGGVCERLLRGEVRYQQGNLMNSNLLY